MAKTPDSSTESVYRVVHFDGRTKIVGLRPRGGEWMPLDKPEVLTRATATRLSREGYSEVELRRRLNRARIPLLWIAERRETSAPTS